MKLKLYKFGWKPEGFMYRRGNVVIKKPTAFTSRWYIDKVGNPDVGNWTYSEREAFKIGNTLYRKSKKKKA